MGASSEPRERFVSHNVNGMLGDEKEEKILSFMRASASSRHPIRAYCAIETWDSASGVYENEGFTIIRRAAFKKDASTKSHLTAKL